MSCRRVLPTRTRGATRVGLTLAAVLMLMPNPATAQPSAAEEPPERPECEPQTAGPVDEMPWAQVRLDPGEAWRFTRGAGVIVAVIDTGVDASVPQLEGRVLAGADVNEPSWTGDWDCNGHGTLVAGIIAGSVTDASPFHGVAPEVQLLPIRQANEQQDGTAGGMADAIRMAVDQGASVINISASAFSDAEVLEAAVDYAHDADVVIVASVSNEFENGNPVSYPAAYEHVVAVGSINETGVRSGFSETGASVDVLAPGEGVVGPLAGTTGHAFVSGTSFAAPFVSATAALVRSAHPDLSAEQVIERILVTADHPGTDRPDIEQGWGVINPVRAVTAVLPSETGALPTTRLETLEPPARAAPAAPALAASTGSVALLLVGALLAIGVIVSITRAARSNRSDAESVRRSAPPTSARLTSAPSRSARGGAR